MIGVVIVIVMMAMVMVITKAIICKSEDWVDPDVYGDMIVMLW